MEIHRLIGATFKYVLEHQSYNSKEYRYENTSKETRAAFGIKVRSILHTSLIVEQL